MIINDMKDFKVLSNNIFGKIVYMNEEEAYELYKHNNREPFGFFSIELRFDNWLEKYNIKLI